MSIVLPRSLAHTGNLKLCPSIALSIFIIFLAAFWHDGAEIPEGSRLLAPIGLVLAMVIVFLRGASDLSPAFWIVLLCAYPLLVPSLSRDLLGYPAFASGSRVYQSYDAITVPLLLGASATILIALNISTHRVSFPRPASMFAGADTLTGRTALLLLAGACVGLGIANFLDAPPDALQLGRVSYRALKENRDETLNFTSGLVIVFGAMAVLCLAFINGAKDLTPRLKRQCALGFALFAAFIVCWQLMAASRVEAIGLMLILYLCFGHRLHPALRFSSVMIAVCLMAIVGYVRTLSGMLAYLSRDYIAWPGGVENVFNTYSVALNALRFGALDVQNGQTYFHLIERLPPQALGLERPARAYDLIAEQSRLIGGEYFLTEPYLNALGIGIVGAALAVIWSVNSAIKSLASFYSGAGNLLQASISLVLFTVCFRALWYGLEHTIKILALALLLAMPLVLMQLYMRRGHQMPGSSRPRLSKPELAQ